MFPRQIAASHFIDEESEVQSNLSKILPVLEPQFYLGRPVWTCSQHWTASFQITGTRKSGQGLLQAGLELVYRDPSLVPPQNEKHKAKVVSFSKPKLIKLKGLSISMKLFPSSFLDIKCPSGNDQVPVDSSCVYFVNSSFFP